MCSGRLVEKKLVKLEGMHTAKAVEKRVRSFKAAYGDRPEIYNPS